MSEDQWVDMSEVPLLADVTWLHAQNGSAPVVDDRWQPIDLSEIPDEPPARPELGGLGIAYRGKRHVFSGPQESAKTLAAYVLGLSVLRSSGVFCVLDFEMGRWDARNRLRELGASQDELAQIVYFEPEGKMPERVPSEVIAAVDGRDALVLIDAAAGAFAFEELDDNKRMDVERFGAIYVEPFRRAGIATLVLDHVVKSSEARGNYAIGSERKVGATDVHLGFTVVHPIKRGGSGVYKITTHKDRGGFLKRGKLADFELHSDPESHAITWAFKAAVETDDEHPFRPTALMEKVSRFLERVVDPPVSRNTVEKEKLGKAEYVREALDVLVAEGFVEETAGPNRSRLYDLITAYREAFDPLVSGSSLVRPVFVPDLGESGSSVRPSPYGGDVRDGLVPKDEVGSSQGTLEDDDGIPF